MQKLHMVDLATQYQKIKSEIDKSVLSVLESTMFIGGPEVDALKSGLANYLNVKHVIPCANGTDALQIALMALDLSMDDEIIVPSFTYVATAEVIALLKLKPVLVDVHPDNFNIDETKIEAAITSRTKAIVPVHLFGQNVNMEVIMDIAKKHNLYVIEDNAQAIGADYYFKNGEKMKSGTIGHIGCTSFFPSKNLGCYGDGGAIFSNDDALTAKMRMIANHGQSVQYYHDVVGVNSRLDNIQAAVLNIKLKYLDEYNTARNKAANYYNAGFANEKNIITPTTSPFSQHVFHQYTLRITNGKRDALRNYLTEQKIPSAIYYPVPLYKQKAFAPYCGSTEFLEVTDMLCKEVISLPMHTELSTESQDHIIRHVIEFVNS